ncbi:MAG: zf-HC2 domain-containing protein [Acidimicrobiia bacterium]
MECDRWREAISAQADGEDPGIDEALVDAHVLRCPGCRAYAANADALRALRLQPAPPVPDLSRRITKLNAIADRAGKWTVVRGLLAAVAIEIIVLALPALVLGDEQDTSAHAARHLGAFSVAYAVGLLVVAVRPARARTILPVASVLAGALALTSIIDVSQGRVPVVAEASHLPEVLSTLFVWLLAVPKRDPKQRPTSEPLHRLRIVDANDGFGDRRDGTAG